MLCTVFLIYTCQLIFNLIDEIRFRLTNKFYLDVLTVFQTYNSFPRGFECVDDFDDCDDDSHGEAQERDVENCLALFGSNAMMKFNMFESLRFDYS